MKIYHRSEAENPADRAKLLMPRRGPDKSGKIPPAGVTQTRSFNLRLTRHYHIPAAYIKRFITLARHLRFRRLIYRNFYGHNESPARVGLEKVRRLFSPADLSIARAGAGEGRGRARRVTNSRQPASGPKRTCPIKLPARSRPVRLMYRRTRRTCPRPRVMEFPTGRPPVARVAPASDVAGEI